MSAGWEECSAPPAEIPTLAACGVMALNTPLHKAQRTHPRSPRRSAPRDDMRAQVALVGFLRLMPSASPIGVAMRGSREKGAGDGSEWSLGLPTEIPTPHAFGMMALNGPLPRSAPLSDS